MQAQPPTAGEAIANDAETGSTRQETAGDVAADSGRSAGAAIPPESTGAGLEAPPDTTPVGDAVATDPPRVDVPTREVATAGNEVSEQTAVEAMDSPPEEAVSTDAIGASLLQPDSAAEGHDVEAAPQADPAAQVADHDPASGPAEPESEPFEQQHERALLAMRAGDYAEAFCLWRPMAEAGDAQAQFSLGWMYHNGYGLAIDNDKTLVWWGRAAQQGLADASFALGMLYSEGADADLVKAVGHYLDAVRMGHGDARHMLQNLLRHEPGKVSAIAADWDRQLWQLIGEPRRIRVDRANVRKGPGTDTRVVTRLDHGASLFELGREGRWVHVAIPDKTVSAWVYDSLVEPSAGPLQD